MVLLQLDIPEDLNTWLMHKTIDLSQHDKRVTIVSLLYKVKEKEEQDAKNNIR